MTFFFVYAPLLDETCLGMPIQGDGMKRLIVALCVPVFSACTINIQIDTDYASQAGGGGSIEEEVTTESTASNTPTVTTDVDAGGL